ncbi:thymidylate synthase (FAD) [Streptomyces sp. V3I8]|uniref:FAD-dependent thymidylate synthase n=1 Tax=Streptomyces sp. V3I8 TaxID=3042279 RepID=UPI002780C383|nr:FAD-dependent thymidylate synthase [Streptomyces sp. V3I8]MDQ1041395.1 thymidylate synthase (FAD) [Streptomyces sp. V3I8]
MTQITIRNDVTAELVKHAAEDTDVTFAARVSTIGGESRFNEATEEDSGLINYLMRDRHGSPFEHNSMTFYVEAPIFVFREFMRHRVGFSYNEESGRYRKLEPVFYVPAPDRKLVQKGKPGRYEMVEGTEEQFLMTRDLLAENSYECYHMYLTLLEAGVAREVARVVLPLNTFSSMYVTCNARSLMHFLGLRTTHPDAKVPSFPQREIEMVAELMEAKWAKLMPLTYEAFNKNGRIAP